VAPSTGFKRIVLWSVVALAAIYAVQGGEYSTVALLRQRSRGEMLRRAIDSVQREVDSLTTLQKSVASDAATQERIAREDFGMVRGNRELLYRFTDADSTSARAKQRRDARP
jgi:cell division protein FtsB